MTLAADFFSIFVAGVGSPALAFIVLLMLFIFIFFITRQSLAAALLLGIVLFDGLDRVSNDPLMHLVNLGVKMLVIGGFAYVLASSTFRK